MKTFGIGLSTCGFIACALLESCTLRLANSFEGIWGEYPYHVFTSSIHGHGINAMWKDSSEHVVHIILTPYGSVSSGSTSSGTVGEPLEKGISSGRDGIWVDGRPVPRGEARRVFVWTKDRMLKPIPLTKEELETVLPPIVEELNEATRKELKTLWPQVRAKISNTEVWEEKIKPVLDKEAWIKRPGDRPDEESDR